MPGRKRQIEQDLVLDHGQDFQFVLDNDTIHTRIFIFDIAQIRLILHEPQADLKLQGIFDVPEAALASQMEHAADRKMQQMIAFPIDFAGNRIVNPARVGIQCIGHPVQAGNIDLSAKRPAHTGQFESIDEGLLGHKQAILYFFTFSVKMNGMPPKKLILASSSIYRRELLERLKIPFEVESPDIDETPFPGERPEETALRLAEQKARKVAQLHQDALVIGCDQVAVLDGVQTGKPYTFENAFAQLKAMRGRKVVFHSALCLYNGKTGRMQSGIVPYSVTFRNYSDERIRNYLEKEEPYHCAGSAKSEGLGIVMIASMEGEDPNALIGLPLIALVAMLESEGIEIV